MTMRLSEKAALFAAERHAAIGQVRKYTGEPYINHPAAVVDLVKSVKHDDAMIAAAWLHDVAEDTDTTIVEIASEFGHGVAELVDMLTDVSRPSDGNRAERKRIDMLHTAYSSPSAKTIKLADLIDNSRSIISHDKRFAKVYMKEKAQLLEVLKEGDARLYSIAKGIVEDYMKDVAPGL